jgi:predicted O-methyltransferase YrrM
MTFPEVKYLRELVLIQHAFSSGRLDVCEWGSGGSTVYFPEYLRHRGVDFSWVAVEHHPFWAGTVRDRLTDAGLTDEVRVALRDPQERTLRLEDELDIPLDDYISYPATLGRKFDLILVDGRRRRRCLLEAQRLLAPHGVVVLHDAERPYYHCAFTAYRRGQFVGGTSFWEGWNTDPLFPNRPG